MRADTRRRRWRSVVATTAMSVALGSTMGASAAAAAAQDAPTDDMTTSVVPTQGWTATGVMLRAGTDVAIRASGRIHFGQSPIDRMAPAGLPWGPQCEAVAGPGAQWVAPGLDCYALIGRIGSGPPFVIGNGATVDAAADGELMLAANDDNFADNSGAWSVAVSVPRPSAPGLDPGGRNVEAGARSGDGRARRCLAARRCGRGRMGAAALHPRTRLRPPADAPRRPHRRAHRARSDALEDRQWA